MMEKARGVITQLPQEQRKTLEMAFFDGLTHSEIAEMTGDPLGTVKTRIRSALLSLEKGIPIMIPVKHIDPDDLALYAMQLLSPEEMQEMTENLQHSAEARRQLAEIYDDLALYAHTTEMQAPPEGARQKLMKARCARAEGGAGRSARTDLCAAWGRAGAGV